MVKAKVEHAPIARDEPAPKSAKVINLMDALRKSLGEEARPGKKPPKSEKEPPARKLGPVKLQSRAAGKSKTA
jgi:DNA end-binding protein Ku